MPSYRRFPSDDEFQRELQTRDLYNFRNRSYWLRRLENHGRKERADIGEYTIEHILPQNENLLPEWRDALGENWRVDRDGLLHTLGNLTLTGYNPEYSDRPFREKRDMEGGFRESPLRVNEGLGEVDTWDGEAIGRRAARLARKAVDVWVAPSLTPEVLRSYRDNEEQPTRVYTIADHSYLDRAGATRSLFDAFRKEVLALEIPQAQQLRLTLNIGFHELRDPQGRARDFTNVGQLGNGDVRVALDDSQDLPYVMGLVRQAFEKQMGITELDG